MFIFCLASVLLAVAAATAVPSLDGRIVGGHDGDIGDFPYQISMQFLGQHMCGGSIISSRHIVTAAHCTHLQDVFNLNIRAGSTYSGSGGQSIKVAKIFQHPKYSSFNQDYDISILELAQDLQFNSNVGPISLPDETEQVTPGETAVCSGWGALSEGGSSPSNLQYVHLQTISLTDCAYYYGPNTITYRMTCTYEPSKDACQGDSGGPLVLNGKLIGVVSWGSGCARPNKPGVYANVAYLRNFIKEHTGV